MSAALHFTKKLVAQPGLAQVSFSVAVLDKFLAQSDAKVTRTRSVGRLKTSAFTLDFGIAPDEKSIHFSAETFALKVPEREREHFAAHALDTHFSSNFLKMQSSHSCIDDGNLRDWGAEEEESFF